MKYWYFISLNNIVNANLVYLLLTLEKTRYIYFENPFHHYKGSLAIQSKSKQISTY